MTKEEAEDIGYLDGAEGFSGDYSTKHAKAWHKFEQEDLFEAVFGDHAQVIVTRDAIYVSEYSHD